MSCACRCCLGNHCAPITLPPFDLPKGERCTVKTCQKQYPKQCEPDEDHEGGFVADAKGENDDTTTSTSTSIRFSPGSIVWLVAGGAALVALVVWWTIAVKKKER